MSGTVKICKRRAFSAIPDDILQDTRMRPETRLVLGWLIGRPDDWEVRLSYLQRVLGLTRDRWAKARKEMEQCGYVQQIRQKNADGTFRWEYVVTDTPSAPVGTIAGKSSDGAPSNGASGNGLSGAGKPSDITTSPNQDNLNTPPPYPLPDNVAITQACAEKAAQKFQGYSIEALEGEWQKAVQKRGEIPQNPDRAFLAWAAIYTQNHPLPYGGGF